MSDWFPFDFRAQVSLDAKAVADENQPDKDAIRERIGKKIGRANPQEIAKVIEGLGEIIGA